VLASEEMQGAYLSAVRLNVMERAAVISSM
jgi:hypothetical protein